METKIGSQPYGARVIADGYSGSYPVRLGVRSSTSLIQSRTLEVIDSPIDPDGIVYVVQMLKCQHTFVTLVQGVAFAYCPACQYIEP